MAKFEKLFIKKMFLIILGPFLKKLRILFLNFPPNIGPALSLKLVTLIAFRKA